MNQSPASLSGAGGPPLIPGYEIEGELGRGTSGIVYRARQVSVDRLVALKVMHMDMVINARSVKRLQREARIAAHLSHPNLIAAIDMGQAGGLWWFAMELVEGPSLAERLEKGGRLRESEALHLFSQLCDALQHASEMGVVHRDIKPANILLERPDFPRIADLGLARIEDDPMLTRTGATLGTPHYISPEQARDPALADVRSDIWSLGATMYHAVCGRPPFAGTSTAEILSSVLYNPIPDPVELRPELSRGLALILRKCLSRDPNKRYFAPSELYDDLALVAAHKAPAIRPGSLEPLDPTKRDNRGLLAIAAVGVVLFALAVLFIWNPWSDEGQAGSATTAQDTPWRPVELIERNFTAGGMSIALALAELDELRERVPDDQRATLEEFHGRLKQHLQDELAALRNRANKDVNLLIAEHDFATADQLLGEQLAQRLALRTGFSPTDLPREIDRTSYQRWLGNLRLALEDRRSAALKGAVSTVEGHARRILLPRVERERRLGKWNMARRLLAEEPMALCARSGCDRRGLEEAELLEALGPILAEFGRRSIELEGQWNQLDGEVLFAEVQRLAESAAERIRTGSGPQPLNTYELDFDRLLERHQIDRELLALSPSHRSLNEFLRRRNELQDLEDERAQMAGKKRLEQLDLQAREFYARRDYTGAIRFWKSYQEDSVLEVVQDTVAVRLEAAHELEALLRRAASGVASLNGKTVSLRQGSITATGKIDTRGDVLERGFRLRETGGSPLVYLLRPSDVLEGTLLDVDAVARFASEGGDLAGDMGLQLQLALFRFHEGDFTGAGELLASQVLQGGALIYYDLGLRVKSQLGQAQGLLDMRRVRAEAELQRLTEPDADAMDPDQRSLEIGRLLRQYRDVLSEGAQSVLVKTRRVLESEVLPSTLEEFREVFAPTEVNFPQFGTVSMIYRFNSRSVGIWNMGEWFFTGDGWSSSPCSDLAEFDKRPSPTLALGDPLLLDSGMLEITLVLQQPKDSPPELFAISAFGFHAIFVGPLDSGPARFLCDTKPLLEVVRRARDGEGQTFPGFRAGEQQEILLRLSRGSGRLVASIDGTIIDRGVHRPPKDAALASLLRLRSIEPVEVREVSIKGNRR